MLSEQDMMQELQNPARSRLTGTNERTPDDGGSIRYQGGGITQPWAGLTAVVGGSSLSELLRWRFCLIKAARLHQRSNVCLRILNGHHVATPPLPAREVGGAVVSEAWRVSTPQGVGARREARRDLSNRR